MPVAISTQHKTLLLKDNVALRALFILFLKKRLVFTIGIRNIITIKDAVSIIKIQKQG